MSIAKLTTTAAISLVGVLVTSQAGAQSAGADAEIAAILTHARPTTPGLEAAAKALIDAANAQGGHDNITVLLISCP